MPGGNKKGLIDKIINYKKSAEAKKKVKSGCMSITERSDKSAQNLEKMPLPNTH